MTLHRSPAVGELIKRDATIEKAGSRRVRFVACDETVDRCGDIKDNIYPRKERPENKIDGVVAATMALGRYMAAEPKAKPGLAFV
jgi:hypothetical protein